MKKRKRSGKVSDALTHNAKTEPNRNKITEPEPIVELKLLLKRACEKASKKFRDKIE